MNLLTCEQLRAYIWTYWCIATNATTSAAQRQRAKAKRDADDESEKTTEVIKTLCTSIPFPAADPWDDEDRGAGWSRDRNALWLRPNTRVTKRRMEDHTTIDNPSLVFYQDRTIAQRLRKFPETEQFQQWRNGEINTAKVLKSNKEVLALISGHGFPLNVPFKGAVLLGNDPHGDTGVVWIGVRQDVRTATLPSAAQAARLRVPEDAIGRLAPQLTRSWWELRPGRQDVAGRQDFERLYRDSPELFHRLAEDLTAAICEEFGGLPLADGVVLLTRSPNVAVPPTTRQRNATNALAAKIERERQETDPSTLVLVAPIPIDEGEDLAFDVFAMSDGALRFRSVVVDGMAIDQYLSRYPWVWSKYFTSTDFRLVTSADHEHLKTILVPQALSDLSLEVRDSRVDEWIKRDVIMATTCIVGQTGAGKSVALWQFGCAAPRNTLLINVSPRADDLRALTPLVEYAEGLHRRVYVIVDRAELITPTVANTLLTLRNRWPGSPLHMFIAYRTVQRSHTEQLLSDLPHGALTIDLRGADLELANVVRRRCAPERVDEDTAAMLDYDATIAGLVLHLRLDSSDEAHFVTSDRMQYWERQYRELLERQYGIDCAAVLHAMRALRELGGRAEVPERWLQAVFCNYHHGSNASFWTAMQILWHLEWLESRFPNSTTDSLRLDGVPMYAHLDILIWLLTDGTGFTPDEQHGFARKILQRPPDRLWSPKLERIPDAVQRWQKQLDTLTS